VNVGLAGLGRMGAALAGTVLDTGTPLTVWNRSQGPADALARRGARVAGSLSELAAGSDVVISMVADDAAAEHVHGGLLESARPGCVVLEMSTLGVPCVLALAERAARAGVAVVDSPVSGSVPAAASGQLVALVGGDPGAIERALPVLALVTRSRHLLGPSGAGAAMKLVINAMLAVTNQALGEALLLAESAGIAQNAAYDALADSAIASPYMAYKRDAFLEPETTPVAFTTRLLLKDVELALALAGPGAVSTSLTGAAQRALTRAVEAGAGDADLTCVAAVLRDAHLTEAR
jgi:3-hydroxyisobutyrate dehydrogenase-like beta-hydroxyacid dehydrogenase